MKKKVLSRGRDGGWGRGEAEGRRTEEEMEILPPSSSSSSFGLPKQKRQRRPPQSKSLRSHPVVESLR